MARSNRTCSRCGHPGYPQRACVMVRSSSCVRSRRSNGPSAPLRRTTSSSATGTTCTAPRERASASMNSRRERGVVIAGLRGAGGGRRGWDRCSVCAILWRSGACGKSWGAASRSVGSAAVSVRRRVGKASATGARRYIAWWSWFPAPNDLRSGSVSGRLRVVPVPTHGHHGPLRRRSGRHSEPAVARARRATMASTRSR